MTYTNESLVNDYLLTIMSKSFLQDQEHSTIIDRGTLSITVITTENGFVTKFQILNKTVHISLCTNALLKGMNPSVLPPAFEK